MLVPNSNPDGLEIGKRVNANHVNLNTDFVALTQPESRALVAALRTLPAGGGARRARIGHAQEAIRSPAKAYMTDFTAQFEIANNPNIVPSLRAFALDEVLTPWIAGVDAAGLNAHRYFGEIRSSSQAVTNGGLSLQNFRNRTGIEGTLSFLMETRLDPKARRLSDVSQHRRPRGACSESASSDFSRCSTIGRQKFSTTWRRHGGIAANTPLALDVRYVADPNDPPVPIELRRIADGELERIEFADSRTVAAGEPLRMPAGYVVRSHQAEIAALFDRQGIRYRTLEIAAVGPGGRIDRRPRRGLHHTSDSTCSTRCRIRRSTRSASDASALTAKPGDLWIDLDQQRGRLAALILEPRSNSSLFRAPEYFAARSPRANRCRFIAFRAKPTAESRPSAADPVAADS